MFGTLVKKEIRGLVTSPRFAGTFAATALLLVLGTFIGIREHKEALAYHETGSALADQQLREATSWGRLTYRVFRTPDSLAALIAGTSPDVGRSAPISPLLQPTLETSAYGDEPLYALFRTLDVGTIVQLILSLLAIMLTYDAVCGEKERGTLRLLLANGASRAKVLAAKAIGSWLGVILPLAPVALLCLLLLVGSGIALSAAGWARVATLAGATVLYLTFWVALGLLLSTLFHRSSHAFGWALVSWVCLVLVVPRVALMAASGLAPVPSAAEVAGRRDAFARERMERVRVEAGEIARRTDAAGGDGATPDPARQKQAQDRLLEETLKLDDAAQQDIEAYSRRLREDLAARQAGQQGLAFALARFSPAAAYQLAAMRLAGTDVGLKGRFEQALEAYRTSFVELVTRKQKETGDTGRVTFSAGPGGLSIQVPRRVAIDAREVPRFAPPPEPLAATVRSTALDLCTMAAAILLALVLAQVRFARYDAR